MQVTHLIILLSTALFALSTQAATFIIDVGSSSYRSTDCVTNVTKYATYVLYDSADDTCTATCRGQHHRCGRHRVDGEDTTSVATARLSNFSGIDTAGLRQASGDFQANALRDSYYVTAGSEGRLNFSGLQPNTAYTLTVVASRRGDDGGRGRTGLYTLESDISSDSGNLDASDNTHMLELYGTADSAGQLTLSVKVDTSTSSRYAYLNAVKLELTVGGVSNTPPAASFTANQVPSALTVKFDASASTDADGAIVSYTWDFGHSGSGSGVTTSHIYKTTGKYAVTLKVTDNMGATHEVVRTIVVQRGGEVCEGTICDNTAKGASVVGGWSRSSAIAGYYGTNYLHDQNSKKGSKTARWKYTIGQAGKYTIAAQWSQAPNRASNVQYRYAINGGAEKKCGARVSQRVNGGKMNALCSIPALAANSTLTVILRNDATDGFVIADAVRVERKAPVGNTPPVASFKYRIAQEDLDHLVYFDASLSTDDGTIVSYDWDFGGTGDLFVAGGVAPVWRPSMWPAQYPVTLTVTDNRGASTSITQWVEVTQHTFFEPILIDFGSPAYPTANSLGPNEHLNTVYGVAGGLSYYGVGTTGWNGVNTSGSTTASTPSAPNNAWRDSIYLSDRDSIARVIFGAAGAYADFKIEIGASVLGNDGGRGSYTNYRIWSECPPDLCPEIWSDPLDASDNTNDTITLYGQADTFGTIVVDARIDPASSSRFGYLGWMRITPINY